MWRLFLLLFLSCVLTPVVAAQQPCLRVNFADRPGRFDLDQEHERVQAFAIEQDDAILARVRYDPARYIAAGDTSVLAWKFVRLDSLALSSTITIKGEPVAPFLPQEGGQSDTLSTCVVQQIGLAGLTAGNAYVYELRLVNESASENPTVLYATQLFVRVREEVHIEVTMGPIYSWSRRFTHELVNRQPEGADSFTEIVERESAGEGSVVGGATFRPWGYDPRGLVSGRNLHFFAGLSLTEKPLENFYLGVGGGGRGVQPRGRRPCLPAGSVAGRL